MMELVVFPDAPGLVVDYFRYELDARGVTAAIGTRLPTPLVGTFVRVHRTGGLSIERVIDQAQLTVDTYAEDNETAHDVAQLCRALLHALRGRVLAGHAVYGVNEFAGPQDFPDTITNKPRFTQTVQVAFRGTTDSIAASPTVQVIREPSPSTWHEPPS